MKSSCLCTMSAVAVTLSLVACSGSEEDKISYTCINDSKGIPVTVAQIEGQDDVAMPSTIPIIRWTSDFGSDAGYTPESRCQEVSANFQKYHEQGILNYITTGQKDQYNIICVSSDVGGGCLDDESKGQLWTLKPEDNASEIIPQIFEVGYLGSSPLEQTDRSVIIKKDSQTYLDVNKHLKEAPTMP